MSGLDNQWWLLDEHELDITYAILQTIDGLEPLGFDRAFASDRWEPRVVEIWDSIAGVVHESS